MNSTRALLVAFCLILASMTSAAASTWNTNPAGVVAGGFDVVSYFTEDRAVQGDAQWTVAHDGGVFYFSNAENRDAFKKSPSDYVPLFGGFCAFGMAAQSAKAPSDPRTYKIYEGQLLLFFNDHHEGQPVNTKVLWNGNESELFQTAQKNWRAQK